MNGVILYGVVTSLLLVWYVYRRGRKGKMDVARLVEAQSAGLAEPASLHPVIDPQLCIGSGSCAKACPEQALGLIAGKAVLVNGSACIGHGACAAACPMDAIRLVFGTAERGVDIPTLSPTFETSVKGIFIAGELGGMGLVRKAAEQGRQAVQAIGAHLHSDQSRADADLDLLIVGAGPAGLSAALCALESKLSYLVLEQEDSLGGAIYHYPRHKVTMTQPVELSLVGKTHFSQIGKEELLEFWHEVVRRYHLALHLGEEMVSITPLTCGGGFTVQSRKRCYTARSVLLAIGRRGTPRKLGVPGESRPQVVYRLIDAEQYQGQQVLVVGGGDSAVEAALSLAEVPGTQVTFSYRGAGLSRVRPKNRARFDAFVKEGRIEARMPSTVRAIDNQGAIIEQGGGQASLACQAVIVCAGGILPTPLLKEIGIEFETRFGTA